MAEPVAMMASPPQRPPPPKRTISPIHQPSQKFLSEREDTFRIVDSRAKTVQKQASDLKKKSPSKEHQLIREDSTSPDHSFTMIDSKHSPLVGQHPHVERNITPPPRPHPPVRQPTVETSMASEQCDGVTRVGVESDPVSTPPIEPTKALPPPRPNPPPQWQKSTAVTDGDFGASGLCEDGECVTVTENVMKRATEQEVTENKPAPPRPTRPPPPRSKSVPRAKSLTAHKYAREMRERSPTLDGTGRVVRQNAAQDQEVSPKPLPIKPRPQSPPVTIPRVTPPQSPPAQVPTDLLVDIGQVVKHSGQDGNQQSTATESVDHSHPPLPSPVREPQTIHSVHTTTERTREQLHSPTPPPREGTISPQATLDNSEATPNSPPGGNVPVVPPRPYLPPRPFPPRPDSGGTRRGGPPNKPGTRRARDHSARSPHHPSRRVKKQADSPKLSERQELRNSLEPKQSPKASESPDVVSQLQNTSIKSHDTSEQGAIMSPSEEPHSLGNEPTETDVNTPTLSITNQDVVQFGFPSDLESNGGSQHTPPDYESSTPAMMSVEVAKDEEDVFREENDQVTELRPSKFTRKFDGKKIFNSVKKGFGSLRLPRKQDRQLDNHLNRRASDISTLTRGISQEEKQYPDPLPQGVIEPLVVKCVAYLNRESVLVEQGLFRIPGDVAAIRKLRTAFLTGVDVDLEEVLEPHTICGLLKLHFRELRVSLIPRGPPLTELIHHVKQRNVDGVRAVISSINVTHIATLRIVVEVLQKVVEHSDVNKMTAGTLATSCGPSMFPYLPPSNANQLLKFLVDHCQDIFEA